MPRLIGSDYVPRNRDYLQGISNEIQKQKRIRQGGIETAQQVSAIMTDSAIKANEALALQARTEGLVAAQRQSNSYQAKNDVFSAIASSFDTFTNVEQQIAKQAFERQKQLADVEFSQASVEIAQLQRDAQEIIYKENAPEYERRAYEIVGKYPNISAEQASKLFTKAYGTLTDIEKQRAGTVLSNINKIRDSYTAQTKDRLQMYTSTILSELRTLQGDPAQLFAKYDKTVTDFINSSDLDPVQAAQVGAYAMSELAKNTQLGIAAREELDKRLASTNQFLQLAGQAYYQYGDNPQAYDQAIYQASVATGVPYATGKALTDPSQNLREIKEHQELRQSIESARRKEFMTQADIQGYDRSYYKAMALIGFNEPTRLAQMKAVMGPESYSQLENLIGRMENYRKVELDVKIKSNSIATQLSAFNASTNAIVAGGGDIEKATNILNQFINLNLSGNPDIAAQLKALGGAPSVQPHFTPAQAAEARQRQMEWRDNVAKLMQNAIDLEQQKLVRAADGLAIYGLVGIDYTDPKTIQAAKEQYEQTKQQMKSLTELIGPTPQQRGYNVNFDLGSQVNKFYQATSRFGGKKVPLPIPASVTNVSLGDAAGHPGDPHIKRNRAHAGLDIQVASGTPVISPVNGKVTIREDKAGYGTYVDVKDEKTGHVHRFAHMGSLMVFDGGRIEIGQQIGSVGQSGNATGPVLHYEIRSNAGFGNTGAFNPESYLSARVQLEGGKVNVPRGDNRGYYENAPNPYSGPVSIPKPFGIPSNSLPLIGGYILNGDYKSEYLDIEVPAQVLFNTANPIKQSYVPGNTNQYNNTTATNENYGYAYLARNEKDAEKLNDVATRLGIPGIWLADIVALESRFDPSIQNNEGATGLLQFYPKEGRAGETWSGHTTDELKLMTFAEQAEKAVYKYLNGSEFKEFGGFKNIGDVAAAVFGGYPLYKLWKSHPDKALRWGDGVVTFEQYLKKLGATAGRQYPIPGRVSRLEKTSPVHTNFVAGCPVCNSIKSSNSKIVPHQQPRV